MSTFWFECAKALAHANLFQESTDYFNKAVISKATCFSKESPDCYSSIFYQVRLLNHSYQLGAAFGLLDDHMQSVDPFKNLPDYFEAYSRIVYTLVRRELPASKKFIAKHVKRAQ